MSNFSLGESVQIVVIDQGFLKDFGHLVDTVYEFAHLADSVGEIRKITDNVIYELFLDLRQHAFGVIEVLLKNHGKLQKDFKVFCC